MDKSSMKDRPSREEHAKRDVAGVRHGGKPPEDRKGCNGSGRSCPAEKKQSFRWTQRERRGQSQEWVRNIKP